MNIDKTLRKTKKFYEYVQTKIKLMFMQRKHKYEDVELKYILRQCKNSDTLAVVFNSCTRHGIKARYNYMRTLEKTPCNQLFLLDDFAEDHRGSYLLGKNMNFSEERVAIDLIRSVASRIKCKKLVFCGSSKGGYCALNIGLQFDNPVIVAGAPQFFLGDYLIDNNPLTYEYITGNDGKNREVLNRYLAKRISEREKIQDVEIFFHYSDKEHTFEEHVKDLLDTLKKKGYLVNEDIADYTNHSDIALYFPDFLVSSLKRIIEKR